MSKLKPCLQRFCWCATHARLQGIFVSMRNETLEVIDDAVVVDEKQG